MQKAFRRAAWKCEKEVKDLSMDTMEDLPGQLQKGSLDREATLHRIETQLKHIKAYLKPKQVAARAKGIKEALHGQTKREIRGGARQGQG